MFLYEFIVLASAGSKTFMVAYFYNFSLIKYHNLVCISDSREAMGDYYYGFAFVEVL